MFQFRCETCQKINELGFDPIDKKTVQLKSPHGKYPVRRRIDVGYERLCEERCKFCKTKLVQRTQTNA